MQDKKQKLEYLRPTQFSQVLCHISRIFIKNHKIPGLFKVSQVYLILSLSADKDNGNSQVVMVDQIVIKHFNTW